MKAKAIPLAELATGDHATVIALRGGGEFQERMISMGVFVGCKVGVLIAGDGGRMVLVTGDTRIALGHGMAEKVMVRQLS